MQEHLFISFTLKVLDSTRGETFENSFLPVLEGIAEKYPESVLHHGFLSRTELELRKLPTNVIDALERLWPMPRMVYHFGPGLTMQQVRAEMAQQAKRLNARVITIGEQAFGVAEEYMIYASAGLGIQSYGRILGFPRLAPEPPIQAELKDLLSWMQDHEVFHVALDNSAFCWYLDLAKKMGCKVSGTPHGFSFADRNITRLVAGKTYEIGGQYGVALALKPHKDYSATVLCLGYRGGTPYDPANWETYFLPGKHTWSDVILTDRSIGDTVVEGSMSLDKAHQAFKGFCDALWGEYMQAVRLHTWDADQPITDTACIVSEEAGEVVKAALKIKYENGNHGDYLRELLQCAAMCFRATFHHDAKTLRGLMQLYDRSRIVHEVQIDRNSLPEDNESVEWQDTDCDGTDHWYIGIYLAEARIFQQSSSVFHFEWRVVHWRTRGSSAKVKVLK